jgi:UPF0755 protein
MPTPSFYFRTILVVASATLIFSALALVNLFPPAGFSKGTIIHIEKNTSLTGAAKILVEKHIVKSALFFRIFATMRGGRHGVAAGDYLFKDFQNSWTIAGRLVRGDQGLVPIRITFSEGVTVKDMAGLLVKNISGFDLKTFLTLASSSKAEGYLFPDTYLFYPNVTPEKVLATLRSEFNEKIKSIVILSPRTEKDVVTLASIIEKEASTDNDRRIIAGILWKRLDQGRLLQVDPPFAYFLGKSSDALTLDDLKVDSPYNTYKYKGLPPTPIDNPGLEAMQAAVFPTATNYWFYLSDKKGVMHYAATYEGHLANRAQYLGK